MSNVIHGQSHQVMKHFRQEPAALAVLWIYASRTNRDNVAWPSARGLAHDTGWGKDTCLNARAFLVEHQALEPVADYVRPAWRKLEAAAKSRKMNLDKAEYFRPTGKFVVEGKEYPIFYYGGETASPIEDEANYPEEAADVRPDLTSGANGHQARPDIRPRLTSGPIDGRRGGTELDSINQDDPKETKDHPISSSSSVSVGESSVAPVVQDDDDDDEAVQIVIEQSVEDERPEPVVVKGVGQGEATREPTPPQDEPESPVTLIYRLWGENRTGGIKRITAMERDDIKSDILDYGTEAVMDALHRAIGTGKEIWAWNFVRGFLPSKVPSEQRTDKKNYTGGKYAWAITTGPDAQVRP